MNPPVTFEYAYNETLKELGEYRMQAIKMLKEKNEQIQSLRDRLAKAEAIMKQICWEQAEDDTGFKMANEWLEADSQPVTPEICQCSKCGEFNMLKCCRELGHDGECCFVVDDENDYENRKAESKPRNQE